MGTPTPPPCVRARLILPRFIFRQRALDELIENYGGYVNRLNSAQSDKVNTILKKAFQSTSILFLWSMFLYSDAVRIRFAILLRFVKLDGRWFSKVTGQYLQGTILKEVSSTINSTFLEFWGLSTAGAFLFSTLLRFFFYSFICSVLLSSSFVCLFVVVVCLLLFCWVSVLFSCLLPLVIPGAWVHGMNILIASINHFNHLVSILEGIHYNLQTVTTRIMRWFVDKSKQIYVSKLLHQISVTLSMLRLVVGFQTVLVQTGTEAFWLSVWENYNCLRKKSLKSAALKKYV